MLTYAWKNTNGSRATRRSGQSRTFKNRLIFGFMLACAWMPACDCGGRVPGGGDTDGGDGGDGGTRTDAGVFVDSGSQTDSGNNTVDARPAVGKVIINEVVTYPVADWNQSSGSGAPFQNPPGTGAVTSEDEYIEFLNLGPDALDLTGWTIDLIGGETRTTVLGVDGVAVFSPGSSLEALRAGDFMVLGNPAGQISTDAYLILRDATGRVVDDVEIGGTSAARDREGDGVDDGAPAPGRNGFARGMFEQSIARPDGADDTDVDQADFVLMHPTPLAPNIEPPAPIENDPPAVIAGPSGNQFPVTTLLRVRLDEPVAPFSVDPDGVVTVTAGGAPIALGFHTFEDDDRTIVINPIGRLPFDQDIVVTVRGGASGITDQAGNPLPGDAVFSLHTEAAPADPGAVVINEICATPIQDWSATTSGDGVPFSETPGDGEVTPQDEWIEFLVRAPGPLDASEYQLVVYNGPTYLGPSREETSFSSNYVVLRVVGSSNDARAVVQGDRIVLGNPTGVIHANTYLTLRTATGQLLDAVELGGITVDNDRGGDGADNGAPGPGLDGTSTGIWDETVSRLANGQDTGNDIDDFEYSAATIGQNN